MTKSRASTTLPNLNSAAFISASEHLGISAADVLLQPRLSQYIAMQLDISPLVAIEHLHLSAAECAKKFLTVYYDEAITDADRKALPMEAYCVKAQIDSRDVLEALIGVMARIGAQTAAVKAAVAQPSIMDKTITIAKGGRGIPMDISQKERMMFHKATGFLPSPKGSHTIVNVRQEQHQAQQQAAQTVAPPPPPERTIRRLVDRFNDARQLPPPIPTESIPQILRGDERQLEYSDLGVEDEGDEG
jgi:hypothetical protein